MAENIRHSGRKRRVPQQYIGWYGMRMLLASKERDLPCNNIGILRERNRLSSIDTLYEQTSADPLHHASTARVHADVVKTAPCPVGGVVGVFKETATGSVNGNISTVFEKTAPGPVDSVIATVLEDMAPGPLESVAATVFEKTAPGPVVAGDATVFGETAADSVDDVVETMLEEMAPGPVVGGVATLLGETAPGPVDSVVATVLEETAPVPVDSANEYVSDSYSDGVSTSSYCSRGKHDGLVS